MNFRILGSLVASSLMLVSRVAAASSSDELVAGGERAEAAGDTDAAVRRYSEAIALDSTHEKAYLHLGALRLKLGDAREASKVYSVAIEHLPGSALARRERANALWKLGDREAAERDLEDYLEVRPEPEVYVKLADWFGEHGRFSAQLRVWRRILALAGDDKAQGDKARAMVKALQWVVSPADPAMLSPKDLADKSVPNSRRATSICRRLSLIQRK